MNTIDHLGLVQKIARGIHRKIGGQIDFDDLVAYGFVGLQQAAKSYDSSRGSAFSTWAYMRVTGAMIDGIRKMRGHKASNKAISASVRNAVDIDDIAPYLPSPSRTDETVERKDIIRIIEAQISEMDSRSQEMMHRMYALDESCAETGRAIGLSKSWTSRLHNAAIEKIRSAL